MGERLDIIALRPGDTPAYMTAAWLGCIRWASTNRRIIKEFARDAGYVDGDLYLNADGSINDGITRKFIEWVNANIWGGPL